MQSKKFRNQRFCVGDLVAPNWNVKNPHGLGVIIEVKNSDRHESFFGPFLVVHLQLAGISEESETDLKLLEQALD